MPLQLPENSLKLIKILPVWIFPFNVEQSGRHNPFLLISLSLYLFCKTMNTYIIYCMTASQVKDSQYCCMLPIFLWPGAADSQMAVTRVHTADLPTL